MTKLSVIVPLYNAEATLRKSVESVLAQQEKEFELILVDDGSLDGSLAICREFAMRDERVHVITQRNAGVSAARNAGIRAARGKYIGFVDADDWIAPDMYVNMLAEAERTDADVVMCDALTCYADGRTQTDTITQLSGNRVLEKAGFSPALLLEMAGSACRCIYRNEKFHAGRSETALCFPAGVKFSEDRIFNLYAFGKANRVAYLKEPYYYRYVNSESAVHRFHTDYFEAYTIAAKEIERTIRLVWDDKPELQAAYQSQLIGGAFGAICNYYYKTSPLSNTERRAAVKRVCTDAQLQKALAVTGAGGRARLLKDQNIAALIIYAKLANWKHGR